jgi:hAT family C-terminal dimerisation region
LVHWIVVMHISFSQVENDWFRHFLAALSPSLEKWIPKAGNTVRAWILDEFERRRKDIKKRIHGSKSRIHLSFDLWTSPNHLSFVGVVGHYMSSQYRVETVLLGLRRLRGPHSGENIAEAVLQVIHAYGLTGNQIGWFMLDNASSNDTCVAEILKALGINDTVKRRRLHCLGHILNLAAKAFLFGSDPKSFDDEIQGCEEEKSERDSWRKHGPIGKLHNVVMYILGSPQRRDEFKEKVQAELEKQKEHIAATAQPDEDVEAVMKQPLMVVRDNQTRWNSVFCMILRAFLLKDPLDLFIRRAREKPADASPLPEADELSTDDWNILATTREILEPFYRLTIRLQGRASRASHGSIWEALPSVEFLLSELEAKSEEYGTQLTEAPAQVAESVGQTRPAKRSGKKAKEAPQTRRKPVAPDVMHISNCVNSCWAKLRKYYALMDESPVYAAAIVLNPEHKLDYFKINWDDRPDWIEQTEVSIEDLWRTMYKDCANPMEAETAANRAVDSSLYLPTPQKEPSDFDQWIARHKSKRPATRQKEDEYRQYLATEYFLDQRSADLESSSRSQLKSVNLCAFWERYEAQYPSLARMAFDMLSIPAMSAECERVFSSAKILLSDRRARMKEDIIEASECLRAWLLAEQREAALQASRIHKT